MRRRLSLAGQLLALQAVVVLVVVLGLTPVLLVQNDVAFRRTESRRVLATAENVADTRVLEAGLATGTNAGVAGEAERARATSGSSYVLVTDADGEVVHSSNPSDIGTTVTRPGRGRSWVGVVDEDGSSAIEARAPVQAIRSRGDVLIGDVVGYGPEPDAVVDGPAAALDLWLWNRGGDADLSTAGDRGVLERFTAIVASPIN